MNPQIFFTLLLSGLFLIGLEIFVPGGVLGALGGLALLASVMVAFTFGPQLGFFATLLVIILLGISIWIWIRFFPQTPIGRALTLSKDGTAFKLASTTGQKVLLDKEGVTQTALRPGGIARIDGNRVDVVAEGGWIDKDTPIKVIEVEGNHVTVREIASPAEKPEPEESA